MSTGIRSVSATQKWSERRRGGGNIQQGSNGMLAERYDNTSKFEKGGMTAGTLALLDKNEQGSRVACSDKKIQRINRDVRV